MGGCTLLTDLDGLAEDAAGVSFPDAGLEAAPPAPVGDAGEAAPDADARLPSTFCNGSIFCDPFDQTGRDLRGPWGELSLASATSELTTDAFSAPGAVRFAFGAPTTNGTFSKLAVTHPLRDDHGVHVELRVKATYPTTGWSNGAYATLFTIDVDRDYAVSLALVPEAYNIGLAFHRDAGGDQHIRQHIGSFSGQWMHVVLDETFGPAGHARVAIDGVVLFDEDLASAKAPGELGHFNLGLGAAGTVPALSVVFDDFLVR